MSFSGRNQTFNATTLTNNGFYPNVSLGEFQKLHRVPSNIADDAVENQVSLAMGAVNLALEDTKAKAQWAATEYANLAAIDATDNGNRQRFYRAAVYYRAKAKLLKDFQTFNRRPVAENQATESDEIYKTLIAESRRAMNQLPGIATTINVELL